MYLRYIFGNYLEWLLDPPGLQWFSQLTSPDQIASAADSLLFDSPPGLTGWQEGCLDPQMNLSWSCWSW